MALDLSKDYLIIDDPVTLSYQSRGSESVWATAVSVAYCQVELVTKADIASKPGLLGKVATVYHLWKDNLSGIVPKVGDKIAFDGENWKAEFVEKMDRDSNGVQRYRVVAVKY